MEWTLEELAHRSGLSARYISNVENDKRDPSLSTIVAIARALEAEPGELLGMREGGHAGREAARLFERLPAEAQKPVLQIMRQLGKRRR